MLVVTGANGFIGSNLVAALRRRGDEPVAVVDHFEAVRYPDALGDGPRIAVNDLPAWLDAAGDRVRGVYHLGAFSSTSVTDRPAVIANNVTYSQTLWRWCADAGVPFVYASSAGTYGDGSKGFDDEADPSTYQPLSLYAESKQMVDLWALLQTHAPPRWAGVKYFNVYGPNEAHKGTQASMAYHWFKQVRDTGEARLFKSYKDGFADGGQQRDFLYVQDAVDATVHLMTAPGVDNGLYNVGTGRPRTFADLARAVFAALDQPPKLTFIEMPQNLRAQYQYYTRATVDKLQRSGFTQPMHTLEQGVSAYVEQLRAVEGASA